MPLTRRFQAFREITAKRDGQATCGDDPPHTVKAGDIIGYSGGRWGATRAGQRAEIVCAECWRHWCGEVAAEDELYGRNQPTAWDH